MKEFVYDNTFEGLLTAIFYAYGCNQECTISKLRDYVPSFLNEFYEVSTEKDKFDRVYNSILEKLDYRVLKNIYYIYLSDILESDILSLRYLKLCYKYGVDINLAKNNDIIILVDKYYKRVSYEAHRFTGYIRFKEIAPLNFYAAIEPDHNILPLLIEHFKRRFSDQNFIIHDLKRNLAIMYNMDSAIITDFRKEDAEIFNSSKYDTHFENLWKTFYTSVNIEERKNHRLRNQHMPKKYWSHITELQ